MLTRLSLDEYRAQLEGALTQRQQQQQEKLADAEAGASASEQLQEHARDDPAGQEGDAAPRAGPGDGQRKAAAGDVGGGRAQAGGQGEALQRMAACLRRRLALAGCSVAGELGRPPTRPANWDDVTLAAVLYK